MLKEKKIFSWFNVTLRFTIFFFVSFPYFFNNELIDLK
jgi:hypothetical protein